MLTYHHLGIPTSVKHDGEEFLAQFKTYVSGFKTSSYGIEWMRFEPDAPLPDIVKTIPHVAFEVDDLARELEGKEILIAPNNPSEGVTVAFIIENGAPVEFLQIQKR
jgi:hypothetical protein